MHTRQSARPSRYRADQAPEPHGSLASLSVRRRTTNGKPLFPLLTRGPTGVATRKAGQSGADATSSQRRPNEQGESVSFPRPRLQRWLRRAWCQRGPQRRAHRSPRWRRSRTELRTGGLDYVRSLRRLRRCTIAGLICHTYMCRMQRPSCSTTQPRPGCRLDLN